MFVMIHELVHVRQYRMMGREQFVNRYLAEALVHSYPDISAEQQAFGFQEWASGEYERVRGTWVAIALAGLGF